MFLLCILKANSKLTFSKISTWGGGGGGWLYPPCKKGWGDFILVAKNIGGGGEVNVKSIPIHCLTSPIIEKTKDHYDNEKIFTSFKKHSTIPF